MKLSVKAHPWRHIVLTGASSGIGAALMCALAREGVTIHAIGRDKQRLSAACAAAVNLGATVTAHRIDVRDREKMAAMFDAADRDGPVDLVIANAAVTDGVGKDRELETPESVRTLVDVNVIGVLNTIDPAIALMSQRGCGQIAIVSSLAGFVGFPYTPAYCMTKAAIRAYGEGLRLPLARKGVGVSVICPGYVDTPMDDRVRVYKPFRLSPGSAARKIIRGLKRNKARIVFPFVLWMGVRFLMAIPMGMAQWVMASQRRAYVCDEALNSDGK